jgi:hypothetical protein
MGQMSKRHSLKSFNVEYCAKNRDIPEFDKAIVEVWVDVPTIRRQIRVRYFYSKELRMLLI